jgi:hypothetical protein
MDLRLPENEVTMVQIDGPRRHVYIKFVDSNRMQNALQTTNVQAEYRHDTGEISTVRIEVAGIGTRRVRIANLPQRRSTYTLPHKFGREQSFGVVRGATIDLLWVQGGGAYTSGMPTPEKRGRRGVRSAPTRGRTSRRKGDESATKQGGGEEETANGEQAGHTIGTHAKQREVSPEEGQTTTHEESERPGNRGV